MRVWGGGDLLVYMCICTHVPDTDTGHLPQEHLIFLRQGLPLSELVLTLRASLAGRQAPGTRLRLHSGASTSGFLPGCWRSVLKRPMLASQALS